MGFQSNMKSSQVLVNKAEDTVVSWVIEIFHMCFSQWQAMTALYDCLWVLSTCLFSQMFHHIKYGFIDSFSLV